MAFIIESWSNPTSVGIFFLWWNHCLYIMQVLINSYFELIQQRRWRGFKETLIASTYRSHLNPILHLVGQLKPCKLLHLFYFFYFQYIPLIIKLNDNSCRDDNFTLLLAYDLVHLSIFVIGYIKVKTKSRNRKHLEDWNLI